MPYRYYNIEQMFQSTRPRRARLALYLPSLFFVNVSIHAPAKGATELHGSHVSAKVVSIHAPAKGATSDIFTEDNLSW